MKFKQNEQVKISVIIPAYNEEKYVERCIESVEMQDIDCIEIICVDDCSTDRTIDIIKNAVDKYNNVICLRNPKNSGLSFSRNAGIKAARGEYILLLDADDWMEPNCLDRLYGYAKERELDILYFEYIQDYESEADKKQYEKEYFKSVQAACGVMSGQERFIKVFNGLTYSVKSQLGLYRRQFLIDKDVFFYEGIIHEDELFYPQAMLNADRTDHVNEYVYHYFKHSGTITTNVNNRIRKVHDLVIICSELENSIIKNDLSPESIWYLASRVKGMEATTKDLYKKLLVDGLRPDSEYDVLRHKIKYFEIINDMFSRHAILFSDGIINTIREAENVIVYGAGVIAKEVISDLHENGIEKYYIATTSLEEEKFICGNKVRQIDELLEIKDNALVLISLAKKYHDEVNEKLDKLGFMNRMNMVWDKDDSAWMK